MSGLLHRAVLATRSTPVVGRLWRAAYRGAAASCAAGLASLPHVEAVVLHRGAAGAPDPGVSDLDVLLVRGSAASEPAWLARLAATKGRLKRAFPMLGDLWVAEPGELERYLRRGGLRAWEDRPGWRVLRGALPPAPPYAGDPLKRRLDAWTWAFIAHMELTRRLLRPAPDIPAKRDADLRKMHADCRRLSDFVLAAGSGPTARARPDGRGPRELWLDSARALAEASAVLAVEGAETERSFEPWPSPAGAAGAAEALCRNLRARGVVLDAPYHCWAVLEDGAGPERLWAASVAMAAEPALPGVPMALTASAW
ncbi:hypothetical protein EPO15_12570, partial [bacterium]